MRHYNLTPSRTLPVWFAVLAIAGCGGHGVAANQAALSAQCSDPGAIPSGAWKCPDPLTVECGTLDAQVLYVPNGAPSCQGKTLEISTPGGFGVGTHTVVVQDTAGTNYCSAQLTVVDTQPPVLQTHSTNLWPPNHKFHEIAVSDCVSAMDACDGDIEGEFIWASSDEPIDDIGDGHFGPDVGLGRDAQHACVRAERQGPKDGRVYKLGVRVTDKSGNSLDSECLVIVDHDQRGVTGKDSGDAYRVTLDAAHSGLDCGSGPPQGQGGAGGGPGNGGGTGGTTGGTGGTTGGAGSSEHVI